MAGRIAPKVSTDGLLMYLDATNTKSYIGSGTTWIDISGKDKNGVLTNGPTFSSLNLGSIVLDGVDDYVRFINSERRVLVGSDWFPMSTSAFTFDTWVKSPGLTSGNTLNGIFSLTYGLTISTTTNGNVYFRVYDNSLLLLNNLLSTGLTCNDNKWHNIVATNDGLTSKIYVDGVFNISMSAPFYGDTKPVWYNSTCAIGVEANNVNVTKFNGNISISKLYNKALSATEILQNYNTLKSRYSFTTINLDTDAQAFITAAGITDSTQQSAINTLVLSFKSYGIWTKMKAIYPMVGGTATTHKFNLKDPRDLDAAFRLVFVNGWIHSSNGALPDGINTYANTQMPFNTMAINSQHLSYYSRTNSLNQTRFEMGCSDGGSLASAIVLSWTSLGNLSRVAQSFATLYVPTKTDLYGIITSNASNNSRFFENGVYKGQNTGTQTTLGDRYYYIGAVNGTATNVNNGTPTWYTTRECAFATIGDGLTDTEAANLYTAVQAYQTTLGRQV